MLHAGNNLSRKQNKTKQQNTNIVQSWFLKKQGYSVLLHPLNFDYVFLHYVKNKQNGIKSIIPGGTFTVFFVWQDAGREGYPENTLPNPPQEWHCCKNFSLRDWGEEGGKLRGISIWTQLLESLYAGLKLNPGMQEFPSRVHFISVHYNVIVRSWVYVKSAFCEGWLRYSNTASYSYLSQRMRSWK